MMFCHTRAAFSSIRLTNSRRLSMCSEDLEMRELLQYLGKLKDYEKSGVPKGAGTNSCEGFDLHRMHRLLDNLGNPQSKFKAVHIAGTKGKGSTAAFLANMLRKGGYSVGCYTSPHLLTMRERITFGKKGDIIPPQTLNNLFLRLKNALDQSIHQEHGFLTHFEILTALAFSFFAEESVDIAIIEAGLGGSRDATNVLSSSNVAASVITTVGSEHLAALGGSLESIAEAKSGIIKEGCPVIIGGPFEPRIESILRQKASKMGSPVISSIESGVGSVIKETQRKDDDVFQLCDFRINVEQNVRLHLELNNVRVRMLGLHQLQNAVSAACTALCLREKGWSVSDQSIHDGIESTRLLGRSQLLTIGEVETLGLSGVSILIDGAHTGASAKSLADTVSMVNQSLPVALVVAMACDKDHFAFAKEFLSAVKPEVVVLTEVNIAGGESRVLPASLLQDSWIRAAHDLGVDASTDIKCCNESNNNMVIAKCEGESVIESIKLANQLLGSRTTEHTGLMVVTGSLHIVSAVLAFLQGDR